MVKDKVLIFKIILINKIVFKLYKHKLNKWYKIYNTSVNIFMVIILRYTNKIKIYRIKYHKQKNNMNNK